jgi:hypothetical protein
MNPENRTKEDIISGKRWIKKGQKDCLWKKTLLENASDGNRFHQSLDYKSPLLPKAPSSLKT